MLQCWIGYLYELCTLRLEPPEQIGGRWVFQAVLHTRLGIPLCVFLSLKLKLCLMSWALSQLINAFVNPDKLLSSPTMPIFVHSQCGHCTRQHPAYMMRRTKVIFFKTH